jgi:uncharacterized protein
MPEKFVVGAELGKLARWLRIMGYDAHYQPFYDPGQIRLLANQERVFLTRNSKRLRQCKGAIFIRSDHVKEQLQQMKRDGFITIDRTKWFTRCMRCNEPLLEAEPEAVRGNVPEYVFLKNPSRIRFCPSCIRFFWPGSHKQNMIAQLKTWGF